MHNFVILKRMCGLRVKYHAVYPHVLHRVSQCAMQCISMCHSVFQYAMKCVPTCCNMCSMIIRHTAITKALASVEAMHGMNATELINKYSRCIHTVTSNQWQHTSNKTTHPLIN